VKEKFNEHVSTLLKTAREALESNGFDTLLLHAGTPRFYYSDDQEMPFRALPHFVRFVPIESPHHLLLIQKSGTALLAEVIPEDYWSEHGTERSLWKDAYEVTQVKTPDAAWQNIQLTVANKIAFIGDEEACNIARTHGIPSQNCNPKKLLNALDASRAVKTPYEIACIEKANERAAVGHTAARGAFLSGKSEREIHYAYLEATCSLESELPYPTIIALNEKSATLHYQHKRSDIRKGMALLIDAGARERGYASDITRTHVSSHCPSRFTELLAGLETLEKKLADLVRPGVEFIEIHHEAHLGIAALLKSHGIITTDGEEAIRLGLTRVFFPHGVGHMLGIQVHDVGSHSPESWSHPLRELYPKIRTNRRLESGNVTTIEPGIYFNELLLSPHRGDTKRFFNWKIIDELVRFGGMRIEDNILVTENGARNLTRTFLP